MIFSSSYSVSGEQPRGWTLGNGSLLAHLIHQCTPLSTTGRSLVLENSSELERAYAAAAALGDTTPPANAEDEVDFHYVCFVRSQATGKLYELDGDKHGPLDSGILLSETEDLLSPSALDVVREFIGRSEGNLNFNLLALAEGQCT